MEIVKTLTPPQVTQGASFGECSLSSPGKLKIQTTGSGATTLLDSGPPAGKKWAVTIQINIIETDA